MMKQSSSQYRLAMAETPEDIQTLQNYIRALFLREFNANVPHFLPFLVGLYNQQNQLCGACGLNPAGLHHLYLEHYLDVPVEQAMLQQHGMTTSRAGFIEIGNFACAESGMARILFAALCDKLYQQQFQYVVLTGTHKIRNVFARMHITPHILAEALPERVGIDAADWGAYYDNHPLVMVGELLAGYQILRQNSLLLQLLDPAPLTFPLSWLGLPMMQARTVA
jgi:hypothetical protein